MTRWFYLLLTIPVLGTAETGPTFNRDIAPIIYENCAACHHPGEAAPFSLLNCAQVRSHAHQIAAVTKARIMPPWLPEPGPYKFQQEHRLTDRQIQLIAKWAESGAPEGSGKCSVQPPIFEPGWQLGKPDLILTAAKPYQLPASGTDVYWNFVLPLPITHTKWLKAIEIRPGDKRLVHHANILLDRLGTAAEMEKERGAGFGGMEIRVESEAFDPDSHLLFWKPGSPAIQSPPGMPLRLNPGADLLLNTHMQPSGKPEWIQPSVGLYFTDQPATKHPMLLELEDDGRLKIPAGDKNFIAEDTFVLPTDVDLLAIYPHAHYLCRDMKAIATFPDGTRKMLIHIPNWDQNWQAVYTLQQPVLLPKGTAVQMLYRYDNSADNIRNPNNPPREVDGGNRAQDEMAHLWLQVLPHDHSDGRDPRMLLQEALSRHEVQKDPTVFEAQYNLASMLMRQGEIKSAIQHYAMAARIRPEDPVVANALGSAELATGDTSSAIEHLHFAATHRPAHFDAHYNLGLALASAGQFSASETELRKAVELKPEDANAHANLGAALAQMGRLEEARSQFEAALKLDPQSQLARDNLAALGR